MPVKCSCRPEGGGSFVHLLAQGDRPGLIAIIVGVEDAPAANLTVAAENDPILGRRRLRRIAHFNSLSGRGLILAKLESGLILMIVQTTGAHLREPRHQVRPLPMV